jgi:hypothetical protein
VLHWQDTAKGTAMTDPRDTDAIEPTADAELPVEDLDAVTGGAQIRPVIS